jgi:hypothetical protein
MLFLEETMDRRRFVRAGTASIAGMTAGSVPPAASATDRLSGSAPSDLDAYLARLDEGMRRLETWSLTDHFATWSGDRTEADKMARSITQSLYVTGMIADLPLDLQIRPEVQKRIDTAAPIMDDALDRTLTFLRSQTPAQLEHVQAALRDENAGAKIIDRFDSMAAAAGVSERRRAHTRAILGQTEWRLRAQPPGTVVAEYVDKVERLVASDVASEMRARKLAARLGEETFWQEPQPSTGSRGVSSGLIVMGFGLLLLAVGAAVSKGSGESQGEG